MKISEFILLICLALMLVLLVYPLIAWLGSILLKRPVSKLDQFIQPVSIIIACSNEELYIREKIESFLDKREWIEGSEIIVVVNNSRDATGEVLKEYMNNPFVSVFFEQGESSKILAVNNGVKRSKNQFLVFSDCRQKMKAGSVKQLISNFNDPQVGTVNSTLMDKNETERFSFRSVLNFIADCESRSGSSLNVFGALYAQRKDVFREFPGDLLFDDLFVTVSTLVQKKRLVSEKQAIIYDVPFEDYYQVNRIRRLARGLLIFLFSWSNSLSERAPFRKVSADISDSADINLVTNCSTSSNASDCQLI